MLNTKSCWKCDGAQPIYKLDNLTDITAGGDLLKLVSMVSELAMISTALSSDFEELGISSENSISEKSYRGTQ